MRFDLVDSVIEQTPDRIVTVKSVTSAEEYLADHFPSFPVLPGVMMLEAMVQAARRLLTSGTSGTSGGGDGSGGGLWVVEEVRNVRYGNMVRPGQQLRVSVDLLSSEGRRHTFQGRGAVGEHTAVQGRFTLRPLLDPDSIGTDRPDPTSDQRQTSEHRTCP